jgi:hypothetical protein
MSRVVKTHLEGMKSSFAATQDGSQHKSRWFEVVRFNVSAIRGVIVQTVEIERAEGELLALAEMYSHEGWRPTAGGATLTSPRAQGENLQRASDALDRYIDLVEAAPLTESAKICGLN